MKLYLGIDGGGTKTGFVLCDHTGRVLAESLKPTSHYLQCGLDGVTRVLAEGLSDILKKTGIKPEDIAYAFVACGGYGDIKDDEEPIRAAVKTALLDIPHTVGNDCENALAGAMAGAPGINIIAGTGSMGFGRNAAGESKRCGGWHHAIGSDEGSGYWIGIRLVQDFTRQSDGRLKKTPLYNAVKEALSLSADGDIIARIVNDWKLDRGRIAALSPIVSTLYDQDDTCAKRILHDAAQELAGIARAIRDNLFMSESIPVSYTGGVFKMGERILAPFRAALEKDCMHLYAPLLPPDRGALILSMQLDGAVLDSAVISRLAEGL
ncbi:MAG TPA: BadF/BadG/BcrA/BcrD ATPase family protein [Clostridia bacterium]|nr:BadF/BadG/BcrA/BcrD ATPase family protein [Clostridia bacterium]